MSKVEKLQQWLEKAKQSKNKPLIEKLQNELNRIQTEQCEKEIQEIEGKKEISPSTLISPTPTTEISPESRPTLEDKPQVSGIIASLVKETQKEILPTPTENEPLSEPEPPTEGEEKEEVPLFELFEEIGKRVEGINSLEELQELLKQSWQLRTTISDKIELIQKSPVSDEDRLREGE